MVPVPGPVAETARVPGARKVAPTLLSAFNMTVHFPDPEHAPDQLEKESDAAGVAVSVTDVPAAKDALQVLAQLMPAGLLLMVPEPVGETVRVKSVGLGGVCIPPPPPQPLRAMAR